MSPLLVLPDIMDTSEIAPNASLYIMYNSNVHFFDTVLVG